MLICELCGQEIKNSLGLSSHLKHRHPEYTVKLYYDVFCKKENEGKCVVCGKETPFITLDTGYRKHCSLKCAQNDENVRKYIPGRKSQFSEKLLNSDYAKSGYHVYMYDFPYKDKIYHYVGHTIHSQIERINNHYSEFMEEAIRFYGKEDFLINYCTIVKWFDDKIAATDFEEQLNIQVKSEFGEDTVLSIANGRKPSKKCIQKAIEQQQENGSWNKGKQLSNDHRQSISNGLIKSQRLRKAKEVLEYIQLYLNDDTTNIKQIQYYIKVYHNKDFILSKETILPYIDIITNDIFTLEKEMEGT